jgi:hypothetical protein
VKRLLNKIIEKRPHFKNFVKTSRKIPFNVACKSFVEPEMFPGTVGY